VLVIRVTFADGATEDREDDSPCIGSLLDPALKHPSEERWYLWLDGGGGHDESAGEPQPDPPGERHPLMQDRGGRVVGGMGGGDLRGCARPQHGQQQQQPAATTEPLDAGPHGHTPGQTDLGIRM
jgi:hypothetical protein